MVSSGVLDFTDSIYDFRWEIEEDLMELKSVSKPTLFETRLAWFYSYLSVMPQFSGIITSWTFRGLPNVLDLILLIFKLFHFTHTLNVILGALKLKRF